ncbi:MAG: polysaccharide deacetylase family protein [Planctomycetota bacterium]
MPKSVASLSLDLDNQWSYMKTHGDDGWESFPSYLDIVVPRVLNFLEQRNLKITFFVVGQDAALEKNHAALRSLAEAGHEIGNHSFHHEPWLHLYSPKQISEEFSRAEEAIAAATGAKPIGFRGPGFSFSDQVLHELASRCYAYDASTFPTFLGPIARLYYFFTSNLSQAERSDRKQLFGRMSEGFRSLRPYRWKSSTGDLVEIPVTTMPIFKVPIHVSYLLYLAQYSRGLALFYWKIALTLCRTLSVEPSLLLHPLDFMGHDDFSAADGGSDLSFFPAMSSPAAEKVALVGQVIDLLAQHHDIVTMATHAKVVDHRMGIRVRMLETASTG